MNPILMRLLKYLQTHFGNKPGNPDVLSIKPLEERSFNRFPIGSEVVVTCLDGTGKEHSEISDLHDISGSGAMFITCFPERYVTGQRLKLDFFLAGTDAVRACIKTEAEVMRIQSLGRNAGSDRDQGCGNGKLGVAVKFYLPLEFQRMDNRVLR
ncbi:MAG: PilZ domain-containing protein [Desulfosalsimonadaceae bacterium]